MSLQALLELVHLPILARQRDGRPRLLPIENFASRHCSWSRSTSMHPALTSKRWAATCRGAALSCEVYAIRSAPLTPLQTNIYGPTRASYTIQRARIDRSPPPSA